VTAALLDRFIWVGICRRHTGGGRRGRRSAPRLLRVGAAPSANFAPAPPPSQSALALRYRLASQVPAYWVPLLPVQTGTGLRLKRGAVLSTEGAPQPVHALGSILIRPREVPREGAYVTRSYQWARWIDGSSHLWVGRRKGVGRGEGSSNLRFDAVDA